MYIYIYIYMCILFDRISFKWHKQASESDYGKKTRKEECNHTYEIR